MCDEHTQLKSSIFVLPAHMPQVLGHQATLQHVPHA